MLYKNLPFSSVCYVMTGLTHMVMFYLSSAAIELLNFCLMFSIRNCFILSCVFLKLYLCFLVKF